MMVLRDQSFVSNKEPFKKLVHQGLITNKGAKMSKSKGNVVDPDPLVAKYGSDVFRMYLMFMGPYTDGGDWSDTGIKGIERFVQRIWKLFEKGTDGTDGTDGTEVMLHRTIKRVTEDMERLHFNTAISALMEFLNAMETSVGQGYPCPTDVAQTFTKLLAPLAPHLAEELWENLGGSEFVFEQPWPIYDPKFLQEETVTIVIQVNGKVRGSIEVPTESSKDDVLAKAKSVANVKKYLDGKKVLQEVYVAGKLLNIVV